MKKGSKQLLICISGIKFSRVLEYDLMKKGSKLSRCEEVPIKLTCSGV